MSGFSHPVPTSHAHKPTLTTHPSPSTHPRRSRSDRVVLTQIYAKHPKGLLARAAAWTASNTLPRTAFNGLGASSPPQTHIPGEPFLLENTNSSDAPSTGPSLPLPISTRLYNGHGLASPARILLVYPSLIQLWTVAIADSSLRLQSSIELDSGCTILDAHLICPTHCVVQTCSGLSSSTTASVYSVQSSSLIESLDVPATCPAPYTIETVAEGLGSTFALIGSNGQVCLYSMHSFARSTTSFRVALSDTGAPLFSLAGRLMAFQRHDSSADSSSVDTPAEMRTPINLPPTGPLYERIMDSVSSNAVASLKTLSDKSYRGIRSYFRYQDDEQGLSTHSTSQQSRKSSLDKLRLLFAATKPICVMDIVTGNTIACFVPLGSVSKISLSPYDLTLAAAPIRGDCIYTYDLTDAPSSVALTGKFIRGKVNASIDIIKWGPLGSLGIVSHPRGSVHWFDKIRSFDDASHRLWKLSGWRALDFAVVDPHRVAVMTPNNRFYMCDIEDGIPMASGEIPLGVKRTFAPTTSPSPTPPSSYSSADSLDNAEELITPIEHPQDVVPPDPLAFFELETCLPYPFIHTDRHVTLSHFNGKTLEYFWRGDNNMVCLKTFDFDIPRSPVDFGMPKGTANVVDNTGLQMALEDPGEIPHPVTDHEPLVDLNTDEYHDSADNINPDIDVYEEFDDEDDDCEY